MFHPVTRTLGTLPSNVPEIVWGGSTRQQAHVIAVPVDRQHCFTGGPLSNGKIDHESEMVRRIAQLYRD